MPNANKTYIDNTELTEDKLIGKYDYEVEPFQEDVTGELSWSIFGNTILRCANLQAGGAGFGYNDMIDYGKVWVLARLAIEMDNMPRTAEKYTIRSWFRGYFRQFSNRNYSVTDVNDNEIGRAATVWALIDTDNRQATDLGEFAGEALDKRIVPTDVNLDAMVRIKPVLAEPIYEQKALFSDLDINGHVNSIKYLEHAMNLFSADHYAAYHLRKVEMAFAAETYFCEQMFMLHQKLADNMHVVEIRRGKNEKSTEVACRIRLTFCNRTH